MQASGSSPGQVHPLVKHMQAWGESNVELPVGLPYEVWRDIFAIALLPADRLAMCARVCPALRLVCYDPTLWHTIDVAKFAGPSLTRHHIEAILRR